MGSKSFNITSSAFVDTLLHKGQYYIILHYAVLHSTELFCTAQKLHCTVIHYTALLGVTYGGGGGHSLKMSALQLLWFGIDSVLKILNKRITESVN